MIVNVIINRVEANEREVTPLLIDPNWAVPSIVTISNRNYEVRGKQSSNNIVTYSVSDSGVSQN